MTRYVIPESCGNNCICKTRRVPRYLQHLQNASHVRHGNTTALTWKATPPDEEFKIIVFSPSFVLHYINEVLSLVFPGLLKDVRIDVSHITCGLLTHTLSTHGRRRVTQFVFSFLFFILHRDDFFCFRKTKK